jgi:signal peptidase I
MDIQDKQALLTVLQQFGSCAVRVEGRSMWPVIRSGERVTIISKPETPVVGFVVAFFNGNQLIVHRIISFKKLGNGEYSLRIQGDSSVSSRSQVFWHECIGIASHLTRNNKTIKWIFSIPFTRVIILSGYILRIILRVKMFFK